MRTRSAARSVRDLRDNLDQVKLNRKPNHLLRDMPLEVGFEDLVPRGVNREAVHQLFDLLDFTSLAPASHDRATARRW